MKRQIFTTAEEEQDTMWKRVRNYIPMTLVKGGK